MQDGTAADLIWPIAYLLADLCRLITLEPGRRRPHRHAGQLAADGAGRHGRRGGVRARPAREPRRSTGTSTCRGRASSRRCRRRRCTSRLRCPRTRPSARWPPGRRRERRVEPADVAARTGRQYLDGLRGDARELWLNGVKITHPLDHDELRGAAHVARPRLRPAASSTPTRCWRRRPATARLVNVTHLIPRSREDLERRRRAIELVAALSGGMMGRTPDYLNVTFACFAGRSDVWARRGNEAGSGQPRRLPGRDARPRPLDDPRDHEPAGRPHQARGRAGRRPGRAAQGRRDREPHHRARRADAGHAGAVRRRAHDLPGLGHPPPGRPLRPVVRDPDGHAGAAASSAATPTRSSARTLRPPALVALRRDGRRGDLRRRRDAEGARVPRRRHRSATPRSSPTPAGAATSCTRPSPAPT